MIADAMPHVLLIGAATLGAGLAVVILRPRADQAPAPLACAWPHPGVQALRQRLEMLSFKTPGPARRAVGTAGVSLVALVVGLTAWVAQSLPSRPIIAEAPAPANIPQTIRYVPQAQTPTHPRQRAQQHSPLGPAPTAPVEQALELVGVFRDADGVEDPPFVRTFMPDFSSSAPQLLENKPRGAVLTTKWDRQDRIDVVILQAGWPGAVSDDLNPRSLRPGDTSVIPFSQGGTLTLSVIARPLTEWEQAALARASQAKALADYRASPAYQREIIAQLAAATEAAARTLPPLNGQSQS